MLDNFFDNLNLTSIIGHHTVPEESLDIVVEKDIHDDNVNKNLKWWKIKNLLLSILQESNNHNDCEQTKLVLMRLGIFSTGSSSAPASSASSKVPICIQLVPQLLLGILFLLYEFDWEIFFWSLILASISNFFFSFLGKFAEILLAHLSCSWNSILPFLIKQDIQGYRIVVQQKLWSRLLFSFTRI